MRCHYLSLLWLRSLLVRWSDCQRRLLARKTLLPWVASSPACSEEAMGFLQLWESWLKCLCTPPADINVCIAEVYECMLINYLWSSIKVMLFFLFQGRDKQMSLLSHLRKSEHTWCSKGYKYVLAQSTGMQIYLLWKGTVFQKDWHGKMHFWLALYLSLLWKVCLNLQRTYWLTDLSLISFPFFVLYFFDFCRQHSLSWKQK